MVHRGSTTVLAEPDRQSGVDDAPAGRGNRARTWRRPSWALRLTAIGAALAAVNVVALFPGLMSTDSVQQLTQAVDPSQLNDWHPPIMTALWWLVLKVTPGFGAMLVVQLALLWSSLTLLAIYVFRVSGSRLVSLSPLLLGLLPYVANISGVIWKDDQLAFAMLAAVVLLLHVRRGLRPVWLRRAALAGVVVLLSYAGAVRYNALPAIIPLLFLITWPSERSIRRYRIALGAAVVLAALLADPVLNLVHPVRATHPSASIMLDDVMHLYTPAELASAPIGEPLKRSLVNLQTACPPATLDVNYTWRCANPELRTPAFLETDSAALRGLYLHGIAEHPLRYLHYRAGVFGDFLDTPPSQSFVWWDGIDANPFGLTFTPNWVSKGLATYTGFASRNFGFLFKPFFWLLAALAMGAVAWRRRASSRHATWVVGLSLSGVIYIVAYAPMVIGFDYRYVYWPAIGVSAALIVWTAERVARRKAAV